MKARYFFILAAIAFLAGSFFLANDRDEAMQMVDKAVAKDRAGVDVTEDAKAIEGYVNEHMGSSVELFLAGSYDRAAAKAQASINSQSSTQVYAEAQASCAGKSDSITQSRCVQNYLSSHAQPAPNPQPVAMPDRAQFTKVYRSPSWTFGPAGLMFLASGGAMALGLIQLVTRRRRRR